MKDGQGKRCRVKVDMDGVRNFEPLLHRPAPVLLRPTGKPLTPSPCALESNFFFLIVGCNILK